MEKCTHRSAGEVGSFRRFHFQSEDRLPARLSAETIVKLVEAPMKAAGHKATHANDGLDSSGRETLVAGQLAPSNQCKQAELGEVQLFGRWPLVIRTVFKPIPV